MITMFLSLPVWAVLAVLVHPLVLVVPPVMAWVSVSIRLVDSLRGPR